MAYVTTERAVEIFRNACLKALRCRTARSYYRWEDKLTLWYSIVVQDHREDLTEETLTELKVLKEQALTAGETKGFVAVLR